MRDQLSDLRNALRKEPKLDRLFPLIVPSSYLQPGTWDLPFRRLRDPRIFVTWVALHENQTMVYVNRQQMQSWESNKVDVAQIAVSNLRHDTGQYLATREKRSENGKLHWIAMMHQDGLGSSRVLLSRELQAIFPEGYRIAIPERSCGMAISVEAGEDEKSGFLNSVRNCYEKGTTPMLPELLEPQALDEL